jgi:hypothetical protein
MDRPLRSRGGDRRIALRSAYVAARTEMSHHFGAIEVAAADLASAAPTGRILLTRCEAHQFLPLREAIPDEIPKFVAGGALRSTLLTTLQARGGPRPLRADAIADRRFQGVLRQSLGSRFAPAICDKLFCRQSPVHSRRPILRRSFLLRLLLRRPFLRRAGGDARVGGWRGLLILLPIVLRHIAVRRAAFDISSESVA